MNFRVSPLEPKQGEAGAARGGANAARAGTALAVGAVLLGGVVFAARHGEGSRLLISGAERMRQCRQTKRPAAGN